MNLKSLLAELTCRLDSSYFQEFSVIHWASPVLSFGDLSTSKLATVGLNPSNREFMEPSGKELSGSLRRFHTLGSLELDRWSDIRSDQLDKILDSCSEYFNHNPYDAWFRSLEKLFMEAGASYYGLFANACHLDLVPYATEVKWGSLSTIQRLGLLESSGDALGRLLQHSRVEVLLLNGQSVIANLQSISDCSLVRMPVEEWALPRRNRKGVIGYSYKGHVTRICGVDLEREISVLGYNHNIQSSFGVTTEVRTAIQKWIAVCAMEVLS